MLAKVIGYGPTRDDARRVLAAALARARLHGVVTNRDLLVGILREPGVRRRRDRHRLPGPAPARGAVPAAGGGRARAPARGGPGRAGPAARAGSGTGHAALGLAEQSERAAAGELRVDPGDDRTPESRDGQAAEVSYRFGRDGLQADVDGTGLGDVVLHGTRPAPSAPGVARVLVDLEIGGVRRTVDVTQAGGMFYADSVLGHSVLAEADRFPDPAAAAHAGSLLAPMPGTVVRVEAAVGDHVHAGAVILAIEAMKMEHAIHAPAAGIVTEIPITVGAQVNSGSVLAVLEEEPRDWPVAV